MKRAGRFLRSKGWALVRTVFPASRGSSRQANLRTLSWTLVAIWGLVACTGSDSFRESGGRQPVFQPPTLEPGLTPLGAWMRTPTSDQASSEVTRVTPTPSCVDGLTFLEDVTIPDGTLVQPGQFVDKRWRVRNSGSCNWTGEYRLKLASGPDMGAPREQALYPARRGVECEIRMLFAAPAEPGLYRTAWQAYNPEGQPFGDPFFIQIMVESAAP